METYQAAVRWHYSSDPLLAFGYTLDPKQSYQLRLPIEFTCDVKEDEVLLGFRVPSDDSLSFTHSLKESFLSFYLWLYIPSFAHLIYLYPFNS